MSHGTLAQLATVVGGRLLGDDEGYDGVSTDTRTLRPGQLFVALRGPNFDGNDYVEMAAAQGAAGALVERVAAVDLPQVQVDDTLQALGRLAHDWRCKNDPRVIALTGSNGKTTVKEMIAAVLRPLGRTHATRGNFNNEIGVPLTLLDLAPVHDFAVIEMGANHAGEIARLTAMARPHIGIVTNAAAAHLEGFGSLEGVARAKGELFEGLQADATAVMNRDDRFYDIWQSMTRTDKVLTFGRDRQADFRVREVFQYTNGHGDGVRLELDTPDGECELRLPLPGQHNAMNAAAAAAACWAAGAHLEDIVAGLLTVRPVRGRLAVRRARCGARVIDDTYNANPASLRAALDFLAAQPGRAWLVLGDMGELGAGAREFHAEIGRQARAAGVERLFALGPLSAAAAESFGPGAERFDDPGGLIVALQSELQAGVTVLVKASRAMHLEQVSDALSEDED